MSPRHYDLSKWCFAPSSCVRTAFADQIADLHRAYGDFPPASPLLVKAGTLILADTSGFHFRGLGPPNTRRARRGGIMLDHGGGGPSRPRGGGSGATGRQMLQMNHRHVAAGAGSRLLVPPSALGEIIELPRRALLQEPVPLERGGRCASGLRG